MALKPCKTCKKEVAHNAKTCPHCGVKDPGLKGKDVVQGLAVIAVIVAAIAVACTGSNDNTSTPQTTSEDCLKDLQCIGEKGVATAAVYCVPEVEKLARGAVKWTDGTLEPKFSHYRWKDKEAGIVTHLGDKVQFQNGFGAYINMVYACDIDMTTTTPTVLGVSAQEGRL